MPVIGRSDRHRIDVLAFKHAAQITVDHGRRVVQLIQQLLSRTNLPGVDIADCRHTATGNFRKGRHMVAAAAAKANHRQIDAIVGAKYGYTGGCCRHRAFQENAPD